MRPCDGVPERRPRPGGCGRPLAAAPVQIPSEPAVAGFHVLYAALRSFRLRQRRSASLGQRPVALFNLPGENRVLRGPRSPGRALQSPGGAPRSPGREPRSPGATTQVESDRRSTARFRGVRLQIRTPWRTRTTIRFPAKNFVRLDRPLRPRDAAPKPVAGLPARRGAPPPYPAGRTRDRRRLLKKIDRHLTSERLRNLKPSKRTIKATSITVNAHTSWHTDLSAGIVGTQQVSAYGRPYPPEESVFPRRIELRQLA